MALHVDGTRVIIKNCNLIGNQDTLLAGNDNCMQYYVDCFIEGTVLAITNEPGFKAFKIEVEVDAFDGKRITTKKKTNRIGEVVYVPFQVSFMEYAGRVINLSE